MRGEGPRWGFGLAMPRDIRRLALVALYQLDTRGGEDAELVRASLDETDRIGEDGPLFSEAGVTFRLGERERAFGLASAAWDRRHEADREFGELAPDWPARRQSAMDRAVLRLAHCEMTTGRVPPKVAVNEAVELSKAFGTEKSPAFVNGLLGRVLKRVLAESGAAGGGGGGGDLDEGAAAGVAAGGGEG